MTILAPVTTGDVDITRDIRLGDDVDGTFTNVDFTGLVTSVAAHVSYKGGPTATLAADMVNEATGLVRVSMGDETGWLATLSIGDDATRNYAIEYEVTYADGKVETWTGDTLPVRAGLA